MKYEMKYDKKIFRNYMILAFGLAWILQGIADVFAIKGNDTVFRLIISGVMLMPLLAALFAKAPLKTIGWKPVLEGNIKYILLALWGPAVLTALGAALFFVLMPGAFDLSGEMIKAAAGEEAFNTMMEQGMTIPAYMLSAIVQCITFAPFLNMLFAVGEEAGWRGVMVPMLTDRFGYRKAQILSGIIWGVWHWPIMLVGYEYSATIWEKPVMCVIGLFVFCIFTTLFNILLEWIYRKTKMIWVPSLAHGGINAAATVPVYLTSVKYADKMILGPAGVGIISMIPFLIVAAIVFVKSAEEEE